MQTDPETLPPLGIGSLIGGTFSLLFRQFGRLFPLAFVPALALGLLSAALLPVPPDGLDPAASPVPALGPGFFLVALLELLVGALITGVMSLAAVDAVIGKRHGIGDYVSQTMRHIVPIIALGILVSLAVGVGLVLFILPGLYVIARYCVYVPAIVFEDAGFAGINRAQDLTRDYRWPLVGAVLLIGLVTVAIGLALSPVWAVVGSGVLALIINAAVMGIVYAVIAIFTALVYARLREIKEGMGPAELAASID